MKNFISGLHYETGHRQENLERLKKALASSEAVVIGAGAGLSTSAGFVYNGARFMRYFSDFAEKYGFSDMYSGGFYPYPSEEEFWAFWSRNIYINRYMNAPKPVYAQLLALVQDKDYFVLTTNVDHCFQKAGFDKSRLFYTQGDYGLWQCAKPCHQKTYDNAQTVREMVLAQGFVIEPDGTLTAPEGVRCKMTVPTALVPRCPVCGEPMTVNLRTDDRFVEDAGWKAASARYADFLRTHRSGNILFLETAVGWNTPGIIKFSFWQMTAERPNATYACLNYGEACAPKEILEKSICIDGDIGALFAELADRA